MASLDFEKEKFQFKEFYSTNQTQLESAKNSFCSLIKALLENADIHFTKIEGRVKDKEECIKKFQRKYQTKLESSQTEYEIKNHITDLIGIRIVCLYEDDIEKIENVLNEHFDIKNRTDKTLEIEKTENLFGYKGLHLDLCLNNTRESLPEYKSIMGYQFETQIRTIIQDSWSVLDHKIKYKKSIPEKLKRRINTLAALFELADTEFKEIRDKTSQEIETLSETQSDLDQEFENEQKEERLPETSPKEYGYHKLNAFNFLKIAQHFFNDYQFEPHKVDGFTQEIINLEPNISRGKFNFYMKKSITKIKEYKIFFESQNNSDKLNPYTMIRHCLYYSNKEIFENILSNTSRENFEAWLNQNSEQA